MKRRLSALAVVLATGGGAAIATAGGAPVAVLIPDRLVCADGDAAIELGWRYTHNPPGARRFSVRLRHPRGHVLLERRGIAARRWTTVRHDPPARSDATGVYRTIYVLPTGTHIFRTRVVRCGNR